MIVWDRNLKEDGQVLIIILLVMIVGLTIGLFLLGRTTSDVSITTKIEESSRAFNAAEAGIEEAIRDGAITSSPVPFASGVSYQVNLADLTPIQDIIYPSSISKATQIGDVFTVFLVPHNDTTGKLIEDETQAYKQSQLDVCFTSNTPLPAVGVSIYYRDSTGYFSSSTGYDPDSTRLISNKFRNTTLLGSCGSYNYNYRASVNLTSDFGIDLTGIGIIPLAMRIRPFYAKTSIAVIPFGRNLPKQGNEIASTGRAGETTRKIEVSELYTVPAPFLDHALYTSGIGASLTK